MDTETQIAFKGTEEEQHLATRTFEVMKRKGMLFGANAPIKMSVDAIVKALTKEGGALIGGSAGEITQQVERVLLNNGTVFGREENGDFVTTKAGHAPAGKQGDKMHTFERRINTEAKALDQASAKEYAESLVNRAAERNALIDTLAEMPAPPPPTVKSQYMPQPLLTPRGTETSTLIRQELIPRPPEPEPVEAEEEPTPQRVHEPVQTAPTIQQQAPPPTPAHQPAVPVPLIPTPSVQAGTVGSQQAPPRRVQEDSAAAPARPSATPAVPMPHSEPTLPIPVTAEGPVARPATPQVSTPQPTPTQVATPAPVAAAQQPGTPSNSATSAASTTPAQVTPAPAAQQVPTERPRQAPPVPAVPAAPAAPVITGPIEVSIKSESGPITIDLTESLDEILLDERAAAALEKMVADLVSNDTRLVAFGSDIFAEEGVERFSKGDFRRIREYLEEPETGGVASDRDIMADVLGRRPEHPDYERLRFSLDYRMLKEKKDFDFVGIDTDRLWIITNSSPALPPVRKPAEVGTDYRFLEDHAVQALEEVQEGTLDPIEYALTTYEYENGVLPYDMRFKRAFPGQVFEDQKSSLMRFEIPQLYGSLIAELRYPMGNRGGFIMGLSELFTEHMVPGARFTLIPTDRGGDVFELRFARAEEQEHNLLQYDERKSRYSFRPVSYAVETDPSMLVTQERFGKLHNQKRLEEQERRRPEVTISRAFEAVGENLDGKLYALLDDIYPVANIERPFSKAYLKQLMSGPYPYFYPEEGTDGAYFYDPALKPA
ncbi:MAG: hypothetical protein M3014_06515 [Chloroflexota bacterium]|nr:hypothetical protein [Chloroflexota bacterium]